MGFLVPCPNFKKVLEMTFSILGGNMIVRKITLII
jgi:hypothetical protein